MSVTLKPGEIYNKSKIQWIRLPNTLGNRKVNVLETFIAKNCKCEKHPAKVFILDCEYMCVECTTVNQFMWMKRPDNLEQFKKDMT